ncbi:MAG TPA: hypothetical protein VFE15_08265 [Marmoricola sp.]|nr:hypothetical protein [Marmoricola sp.]
MVAVEAPFLFAIFAVQALAYARVTEQKLQRRIDYYETRYLARVEPGLVRVVNDFTRRASYAMGTCLVVTGSIATTVLVVTRNSHLQPGLYFPLSVALFLPAWSAYRLVAAGREFPLPAGSSVTARPRRVTPGDYVPAGVRALLAVDLVVVTASAEVAVRDPDMSRLGEVPVLTAVAVLLAAGAAVPLITKATCDRPQPAADQCTLYFLDAWRAEALRSAYGAVGLAAVELLAGVVVTSDRPALIGWGIAGAFAAMAIHATVFRRSVLHFRRRLWPTLAPGQVLRPGEVAPAKAPVAA